MPAPAFPSPRIRPLLLTPVLALLTACGGAGPSGAGTAAPGGTPGATDAEWRALAKPRPTPLEGAPRVAVGDVSIQGDASWTLPQGLEAGLAVQELVAAGLLRREDVHFVERRRFEAAVDAERRGAPRPAGAPAAGISPGAEFVVSASWAPVVSSGPLDVRILDAATGEVLLARRGSAPRGADAASVARTVVAQLLAALDELGRRPVWSDPIPDAAPAQYRPSGIPSQALESFLRGLAAEERWNWDGARRGYQGALSGGGDGFVEAVAALARAARLRNGGTLGAS